MAQSKSGITNFITIKNQMLNQNQANLLWFGKMRVKNGLFQK